MKQRNHAKVFSHEGYVKERIDGFIVRGKMDK